MIHINGVAQGGGDCGGLYGINVEVLTGAKTLTPGTDEIYQYLNPITSNRNITLDTVSASAGDRFVIRNTINYSSGLYLRIYQGVVVVETLYSGRIGKYIYDGSDWQAVSDGAGDNLGTNLDFNVAHGNSANAYNYGTAIGSAANAAYRGAALGFSASAYYYGFSIGYDSTGQMMGGAIGYKANNNGEYYAIALGYYSETERCGELARNIGSQTDQENNITQGGWEGQTTNNTPAEIFCAGESNQRFTIRASSVLAFTMKIVARDNTANEVAMYTVSDGLIKRDGAGNTTMVNCTVTTVHEDDATWDCAVTADDTNEALIITVTGDAANTVQWAVVMDGVETHF